MISLYVQSLMLLEAKCPFALFDSVDSSVCSFVLLCFVLLFFMKTTKYSVLIAVFLSSVDGGFSLWSTWTTCSATCGTGTQSRNRTCTNPVPVSNGLNCTGNYSEATSCKIASCPGKLRLSVSFPSTCKDALHVAPGRKA